MQLAVISDLHLGPGDASDDFGHRDDEFIRFLRQLEGDFDRIVLLGDIWETLTTERPFDAIAGLARARRAHQEIAERLLHPKYVYVHGNHDLIAASVERAPAEWQLDCGDIRLLFTHGHHHDWLIRKARWFSESCVWLGAWTRRLGCNAVYRAGYWIDHFCSRPAAHPNRDSFQRWAMRLAQMRSADVIVTGHTHVAGSESHSNRLFLNSGSCSEGQLAYLAIDTKALRFDVLQILRK